MRKTNSRNQICCIIIILSCVLILLMMMSAGKRPKTVVRELRTPYRLNETAMERSEEVKNLSNEYICFTNEATTCSDLDEEDKARITEILESLIDKGMSRYDKIKAVHDWIVKNMAYDKSLQKRSAKDMLRYGKAVCKGYAELFKEFMDRLEIPCIYIVGYSTKSEKSDVCHVWNACQMEDGLWYYVDCCWDDPVKNGSSDYKDGSNLSYDNFLIGAESLAKKHIPCFMPQPEAESDYRPTN